MRGEIVSPEEKTMTSLSSHTHDSQPRVRDDFVAKARVNQLQNVSLSLSSLSLISLTE